MKTLLLTLTYTVGMGELILAMYFWATNSKSEVRRVMGVLAFFTGCWALLNAATGTINSNYYLNASTFVAGCFLIASLLHLTLVFPHPFFQLDRFHRIFIYLPAVFFTYAILFTKTVVIGFPYLKNAGLTLGGPLFVVLNLYLGGVFVLSLLILFLRSKRVDGTARQNTLLLFWTILIGGIPGIFFAVLHLLDHFPFNYLYGPIGSMIWFISIMYILRKK